MSWVDKVRTVEPYVPGEQPREEGIIKLNTNECPYPPAPGVKKLLPELRYEELRLYPSTDSASDPSKLHRALAAYHGITEDKLFVGIGSDDVISLAFLTFFASDKPVYFPDITYSFYKVWAELYRIPYRMLPLTKELRIDTSLYDGDCGGIIIPNPNAPTGVLESREMLEELVKTHSDCVVMVDEAYVDFAGEGASMLPLTEKYDNLLVIRTFSKSRSLAGLRVGYAMGDPKLIRYLNDVKFSVNSYTLNRPAIELGTASVEDDEYFKETVSRVVATRERMKKELCALGFDMPEPKGNFVFARHKSVDAPDIFKKLREKKIYVRYFNTEGINDRLRISVGTEEETDRLLEALRDILDGSSV